MPSSRQQLTAHPIFVSRSLRPILVDRVSRPFNLFLFVAQLIQHTSYERLALAPWVRSPRNSSH